MCVCQSYITVGQEEVPLIKTPSSIQSMTNRELALYFVVYFQHGANCVEPFCACFPGTPMFHLGILVSFTDSSNSIGCCCCFTTHQSLTVGLDSAKRVLHEIVVLPAANPRVSSYLPESESCPSLTSSVGHEPLDPCQQIKG